MSAPWVELGRPGKALVRMNVRKEEYGSENMDVMDGLSRCVPWYRKFDPTTLDRSDILSFRR